MKKHQLYNIDIEVLDKVEKHICNRISKVSVKKGRSIIHEYESTLALMVKRPDWVINLREMISKSVAIIDTAISRAENELPNARLTNISINIGRSLIDYEKDVTTKTHIRIGDIFLDGLFVNGIIRISQPGYEYKDSTWFVSWTEKGLLAKTKSLVNTNTILRDTAPYPMEPTTEMLRSYAGRKSVAIKRSGKKALIETSTDHIKALDKMQHQAWKVNTKILDVIKSREDDFVNANESRRIAFKTIIQKAEKAAQFERFYQGYDIDYRGRFYVMEPFFSFQGQDVARGLFLFADGVQMTDDGWYWLFVHTANCFNQSFKIDELPSWCEEDYKSHLIKNEQDSISVDKMSLNDRVAWTQENLSKIMYLGENILFWKKNDKNDVQVFAAEKPVSFLAACVEIFRLSLNPNGMTYLPIGVDGSNNGWQHLVAMAKDDTAAHLVGMVALNIPEDFYLSTGRALIARLEQSTENNDVQLYNILRKIPMRDIRKGISKRGSMTRAYSAGAKAIATNMWADCKQADFDYKYFNMDGLIDEALKNGMAKIVLEDKYHPEIKTLAQAATYIAETTCFGYCNLAAKHLVDAINDVCPGPLASMNFFMKLAQYEVGIYKWVNADGDIAEKDYKVIKARRTELMHIDSAVDKGGENRRLTETELDELNDLSRELMTYSKKLVKGNGNASISWTTPSGFRVNSEHFTKYRESVSGQITDVRRDYKGVAKSHINHMFWSSTKNPAIQDTVSAISPNIVHSYDAAHLAIAVANWKGAIGVIHDSYSTHAPHVPEMIDLIKDVFVDMYENKDVFGKLKNEILADDRDFEFKAPTIGDLDFNGIYDSDFFFS